MATSNSEVTVTIAYTNYRGEHSIRRVIPKNLYFGMNKYHNEPPQWFLEAWDCDKGAMRTFAMKDVHLWRA